VDVLDECLGPGSRSVDVPDVRLAPGNRSVDVPDSLSLPVHRSVDGLHAHLGTLDPLAAALAAPSPLSGEERHGAMEVRATTSQDDELPS
jgi:hypothetical protein